MPKTLKSFGIASIALLLLIFIGRTQYEYKIQTGTIQFSAFGGWLMAANALYGYAYSKPESVESVPLRFRELHAIVNQHMDSLRTLAKRPDEKIGIYYVWDVKSPLQIYMKKRYSNDPQKTPFTKWASIAPVFAGYGRYLIAKHPREFLEHFVWPNLIRYYSPPAYFMEYYNLGQQTVDPKIMTWFDWANNQLPTRNKNRKIKTISMFPTILSIINSLFLICSLMLVGSAGFRNYSIVGKRIISSIIFVWIANIFFSILSAPIELRYELFPLIVIIPFTGLFMHGIVHSLQSISLPNKNKTVSFPETNIMP